MTFWPWNGLKWTAKKKINKTLFSFQKFIMFEDLERITN